MESLNASFNAWVDQYLATPTPKQRTTPIYGNFRLPIQCLDQDHIHPISEVVASDLDLVPMYRHLFLPTHTFGTLICQEWGKQHTSNVPYLKDTQALFQEASATTAEVATPTPCDALLELWKDTKEHPTFLEHYGYLDWKVLLHLNRSSSMMQFLSVANVLSPLFSLLLPLLFLVVPFLLLKIQGLPITMEMYLAILKDVARNHFIGKALTGLDRVTPDKVMYMMFGLAMYGMQMYHNINTCQRFVLNLQKINRSLLEWRAFLEQSRQNIVLFEKWTHDKATYQPFRRDMQKHADVIDAWLAELNPIRPLVWDLRKTGEVGYLLKCFYRVHDDDVYEETFQWCLGFEGYMDNVRGLARQWAQGHVHPIALAKVEGGGGRGAQTRLEKAYHPTMVGNPRAVSNTLGLDKNGIITGPNASGKTTLLKTTLLNLIFSQQVGCGFYELGGTLTPYTHIHSYLNIPDTSERDSLFQAEARRCKDILEAIEEGGPEARHVCIFDELYSGTNPVEASKASLAFLVYLSRFGNVNFLLTTHYVNICAPIRHQVAHRPECQRRLRAMKMDVEETAEGALQYTYRMVPGVSRVQGAGKVLETMGYPAEITSLLKR